MSLFDTIPGYRDAVESEKAQRNSAFIDAPEYICGQQVQPLTIRHCLMLEAIGSPFMGSIEAPSLEDCVEFAWIVSGRVLPLKKLAKRFRKVRYAEFILSAKDWLTASFQDSPGGIGVESVPFCSWAAGTVDQLATEYHWREADVLDMPVKRVFQYLRIIKKRDNPDAILFNPSDRVRGEWLKQKNGGN